MTLQIDFPGPNEQGVTVIRAMVIGGVGYGKTSLMSAFAPEFAPKERWVVSSPVDTLSERLAVPNHRVYGRDRAACERFFGNLIKSGNSVELLMDEFDEHCPGGPSGASGGYSCESLYRIVNYARNKDKSRTHGNEIALFVSSRGMADLTTNTIRCMDVVFFAQQWEGNAMKYIRSSLKQGDIDFERILRNQPKYVFMVWCPQAGGFKGFVHVHEDATWGEWDPDAGCDACDFPGMRGEVPLKEGGEDSSGSAPDEKDPGKGLTRPRGASTATSAG